MSKCQALIGLEAFAKQRPCLGYGNYCSGFGDTNGRREYQREVRAITKDLHKVREAIRYADVWNFTDGDLIEAAKQAFGGRLSITKTGDKVTINYCTGQYFPTEYRKAVLAVLERATSNAVLAVLERATANANNKRIAIEKAQGF